MTPARREFYIAIRLRGDDGSEVFRTLTIREDFDNWLTMSFGDVSGRVIVKDRAVITLKIPIEGVSNLGKGTAPTGIQEPKP